MPAPRAHLAASLAALLAVGLGLPSCGEPFMAESRRNLSFVALETGAVRWGEPIRFHLQGRLWQGPYRWALWSTEAQGRQSLLLAEGSLAADAPGVQSLPSLMASPGAPPRSTWALDSRVLPVPPAGQSRNIRLEVTEPGPSPQVLSLALFSLQASLPQQGPEPTPGS